MQKKYIILSVFLILYFFSFNTFSQINPGDSLAVRVILDSTRLDTVSNESLSDTEVTIEESKTGTDNLLSENPCEDSLYNVLKKKSLDNMTDREYEYFMMKVKLCTEASRPIYGRPILTSEVKSYVKRRRAAGIPVFILGYLSLSATIPFIMAATMGGGEYAIAIIPLVSAGTAFVITGHILYAKAVLAEETGTISKAKTSKPIFYISFDF